MIRGVGPYSALITPQAGSLFHAVFQTGGSDRDEHAPDAMRGESAWIEFGVR